jgi:TolB-like protein/Tfp pilus assembly protein PilF
VLIVAAGVFTIWNFYFRPPPIEPASEEKMAYSLPDQPSIAVLPFVNMSEDKGQEFFCDGITEEIITALSKTPKMFVIARNSTFTYKGKAVKANQVAEELGVQYVLEGSVRKEGDRVRITAQLIDAIAGHHLWAERYDRDFKDIFALQDEITIKIIGSLRLELTDGQLANLHTKGTENLEAYLKLLQLREPFNTLTKEGNAQARHLSEEAIAIDPEYSAAYVYLGATHWLDISLGSSKSPKESLKKAFNYIKKAIALDDSLPEARTQLGWLYVLTKQYDKGIAECERAITLAPNSAHAHIWMGLVLTIAGRHQEAVRYSERALRLDPLPPQWYFRTMGLAYAWVGRDEEAITFLKKSLQLAPNDFITNTALTAIYSWAGHMDEAKKQASEVLRIDPNYSIERLRKRSVYKNKEDNERYIEALRKAGLPETPPLPLPDKPSIAVLPFVNMSGDPEQEYFSDGITEEIITALSKTPKLFVIARTSSFKYKGKEIDVRTVGRELGVRYVLEGSVRKAEDRVRITAQLIDSQSGNHLWADRYDRDLKDIFAIQDEVTLNIITALQVKLSEGEEIRIYAKGTKNLEAYLRFLEGLRHLNQVTREGNAHARQFLKDAITLDPEYPAAYAYLATTHLRDIVMMVTKSLKESLAKAIELAKKAIELDESLADAHALLGYLFTVRRQHDKGVAQAEQGIALNPNSASAYYWYGMTLNYAGRHDEAIKAHRKAIRLNPFPPTRFYFCLAFAYRDAKRYEEAIAASKKALEQAPNCFFAHTCLASCYALMGRQEEAHAEMQEALRINPRLSLARTAEMIMYKYEEDREFLIESFRKAGLK